MSRVARVFVVQVSLLSLLALPGVGIALTGAMAPDEVQLLEDANGLDGALEDANEPSEDPNLPEEPEPGDDPNGDS